MIQISLRETIIILFILVAYGLFAFFSINTFFEYKKEITGFSQMLVDNTEMAMPTVTVCSQNMFKNFSKETNPEIVVQDLNDYVYGWGDLFIESMMPLGYWNNIHEIFSHTLGLCYSLSSNKNITGRNYYYFYIYLPVGKRYQVWFLYTYLPISTYYLQRQA